MQLFSEKEMRSPCIYERHPAYPPPPLPPLPDLDNFAFINDLIAKDKIWTRRLVTATLRMTGFKKFSKQLPDKLETLMRHTNMRSTGLFMPVISASLALKDDPGNPDPLDRAATLVKGAYSLYEDISSGTLPADTYKEHILEMGQYPNLFSTCVTIANRRPVLFKSKQTNSLLVMVNRRQFIVTFGDEISRIPAKRISRLLGQIVEEARQERLKTDETDIGILSAATSGTQFKAFRWLEQDKQNRRNLEEIRHTFVTLCLDLESSPATYAEVAFRAHADNTANRWFHSSLQMVVFANGRACIIGNFGTYIDGNVMMRGAAEIQRRAQTIRLDTPNASDSDLSYKKLSWRLPRPILQAAWRDVRMIADAQQATFEIENIGRNTFLPYGLQPVNVFILALELAVYRFTGRVVRVTQFLSMSKFRYMGLITAVVTTPEVEKFVNYFARANPDAKKAFNLLKEAVDSQIAHTRKARRTLPFHYIYSLFVNSKKGLNARYVVSLTNLTGRILGRPGIFRLPPREILISHPAIHPEVPVLGRPGIRLPYVKYFGLHYQIFDNKTVITMMPGVFWRVPNSELIDEIRNQLVALNSLIQKNN